MLILFNFLQYVMAFILGVLVSTMLSGAQSKSHYVRKTILICVILLTMQALSFHFLGLTATKKIYPLIVHLPLWVLLVFLLKTPKLQTAVSVLMAYMCC